LAGFVISYLRISAGDGIVMELSPAIVRLIVEATMLARCVWECVSGKVLLTHYAINNDYFPNLVPLIRHLFFIY